MKISSRVKEIQESVTLALNAKAIKLESQGKTIYNLTAGQLPYRPPQNFLASLRQEADFLKSYQYSPVAGFKDLRKKLIDYVQASRKIELNNDLYDCIVCNGGKHALTNVLGALVDPGDEVIILQPYWLSYPEMIKFCRGVPIVIEADFYDHFCPPVDRVEKMISSKTKAIIINSPNNPSGISYSQEWMKKFGELMLKYPDICLISDEIYFELSYYDPKPSYFYQFYPQLLSQTIIVDGISKSLASTGLRLGYAIADKKLINAIEKLQGQTTSGANSLVQRAVFNFDFTQIDEYLNPIKLHLRENSKNIIEQLRDRGLSSLSYQTDSAFYFLLNFSKTPYAQLKLQTVKQDELTGILCSELIEHTGVVVVPGESFGAPLTVRLSLVTPTEIFKEAVGKFLDFLLLKNTLQKDVQLDT